MKMNVCNTAPKKSLSLYRLGSMLACSCTWSAGCGDCSGVPIEWLGLSRCSLGMAGGSTGGEAGGCAVVMLGTGIRGGELVRLLGCMMSGRLERPMLGGICCAV